MARFDLVGEVRRSIEEETGEPCSRSTADVMVDRMCFAFGEKVAGAGYEYAVSTMPDVARHLAFRWTGEEGRQLRKALGMWQASQPIDWSAE